jgi:anthranilate synthase/aminodeoxychorismate synthase-like glutamine amidotransferase
MIVIVDNYDSFTYNLAQLVGSMTSSLDVIRNDRLTVPELLALRPSALILSPGPGRPEDAGITLSLLTAAGPETPIFGVCLGHQAIGAAFGARIVHAPSLMHGRTSAIHHDGTGIFQGLPAPFTATRYHSLVIDPETVPDALAVTARTGDGVIMAVRHRTLPIEGVQFHPESLLTEDGGRLLRNWLEIHACL